MIAPSPDWYMGFSDAKPRYETFEIETYPWDAGIETGDDFDTNNASEKPLAPIEQLIMDTVPGNKNFLSPDGDKILPMATWSCTLVASSCSDHDGGMLGKPRRNCAWAGKKPKTSANRCKKKYRGKSISKWCPDTCGGY